MNKQYFPVTDRVSKLLCSHCSCVLSLIVNVDLCSYLPQDSSLQSETVHFKRGVCQQFCLPSHTVNLSEWADDEVGHLSWAHYWNSCLYEAMDRYQLPPAFGSVHVSSPAAVWYGQGGVPHGGAGRGWWGRRWVCVCHSALMVTCERRAEVMSAVFNFCRTSGTLSHLAGNVWEGKKIGEKLWCAQSANN